MKHSITYKKGIKMIELYQPISDLVFNTILQAGIKVSRTNKKVIVHSDKPLELNFIRSILEAQRSVSNLDYTCNDITNVIDLNKILKRGK